MNSVETLLRILRDCFPAPIRVGGGERLRALLGGLLGILFTALASRALHGAGPGAWLVAPLGASAVLVFAVPASPLAQPWSVIGGNTLSALVGAVCGHWIHDPAWAGAVAVGMAIAVMFSMRCLHPPGGAAALLSALGAVPFGFALFPVCLNCLLLVLAGMVYNGLTGRRYPHGQGASAAAATPASAARFSAADLDAALTHYNQVVDIGRDDLEELLHHAEAAAYQRSFGAVVCADIMTPAPLSVEYGSSLDEAWALLQRHHVKALPVIDRAQRVIGIVTPADFLRHAAADGTTALSGRVRAFVQPSGKSHSDKPEVVGQIMSPAVHTAALDQRVSELVSLYAASGHHHLPVVGADRRLVGILTQSDVIRALDLSTRR